MLMHALEDTLHEAYREAGSPYGLTEKGLWIWWQQGGQTTVQ
jgi:hypothetical protein